MATPAKYDLTLYQGDTWSLRFSVRDPDGNVDDLAGATARCQLRDKAGALAATATAVIEGSQVRLSLTTEQTGALKPGLHAYDVELTTGDEVRTVLAGKIKVVAEVTR